MKTIQRESRRGRHKNGGFSLAEMLLAVAIIAILSAVGFINGVDMIRGSRQTAMDRQAEQIFLALSRNLQGLEASGNTTTLADTVKNIYGNSPFWLIEVKSPANVDEKNIDFNHPSKAGSYAFYHTEETPTDGDYETLRNLLFPEEGLSAALSADLQNGCWLVVFTPGLEMNPSFSAGGDTGEEARIVRPAVHQVYFAKNEDAAKRYFGELLKYGDNTIGAESVKRGIEYYKDRAERLKYLDGYVGYYGGDSVDLNAKTNKSYKTFTCWMGDVKNAEILSVPVYCGIPKDDEYKGNKIIFTLKITGKTSRKTVELIETIPGGQVTEGTNEAVFVLDKLGAESLQPKDNQGNTRKWKEILNDPNNPFIPGEDLQLALSATVKISDSHDFETEDNKIQTVNSLFADGTMLKGGVLTAKIAYGRHLQNLNRGTSGVGESASVTKIGAVQTQDIYFSGPYVGEAFDEAEEQWAATYYYQEGGQTLPKTFLPIISHDENGRDDKLLAYDGGKHTIYNLTVNYENVAATPSAMDKYKTNAGLFSVFGGDTIKNLTLIDPVIQGVGATQTAGGLAGALSMTSDVTIDQCALYMTSGAEDGTVINRAKDAGETPETGMSWLTTGAGDGKNAGGLVGKATGTAGEKLTITKSFASTVVKAGVGNADHADHADEWSAGCHAGGLIGMADGVSVDISLCYAGSYLFGANTGGLVGGTSESAIAKITNSYAAGFQTASVSAAGLLNGAGEISHSYSVSGLSAPQMDSIAPDTVTFNPDSVFNAETLGEWYQIDGDVERKLGGQFTTWSSASLNWGADEKKTYPYNLKGQSLKNYTYPRLKPDFLKAYHGDWKPEVGILTYYEIHTYANDSAYEPKQEYRVAAESLPGWKSGDELKKDLGKITADGYGVLLDDSTEPSSLTLSFGSLKTESGGLVEDMKPEISIKLTDFQNITVGDTQYVLYPISQEHINRALYANQNAGKWNFYELVQIVREETNGDIGISYYRFNPHFATVPNRLPNPNVTSVTWKQVWDEYLLWQTDEMISIRTARQLRCLSEYYSNDGVTADYYAILKDDGTKVTFKQECDIDYRAYNWDEYAPQYRPALSGGATGWKDIVPWKTYATESIHYSSGSQDRDPGDWDAAAFTQRPIAEKQTAPFVNAYNGECYVITGLSVMASQTTEGGEKAIGLFGWNQGSLENIVFVSPFDRDDHNSPYVVGRKQDIGYNRRNETVYLGVLTGYNGGKISNCATAGYYLAVSGDMREPSATWTPPDDKPNAQATDYNHIRVLNQSTLYAGGFVGRNDGTIQNASVSAPRMFAHIHLAHAYAGGFAGWSDGQISNAYSLGWVDADSSVQTSDGDYNTSLAGFCAGAGRNAKTISHSYCAVAITGSGTFKYTNAFAPSMVKATSCYYLHGPVAKYLTELHNYDAFSDRGTPRNETQLRNLAAGKTVAVNGDGEGAQYWHDMPESEWKAGYQAEGYLYPAYVTDRSGRRCHYGNWLEKQSLGQMGLFYWENEEGGSNAGYHISFLGVYHGIENEITVTKPITGSTLCIRHNDDGVIQTYGYGYYWMTRGTGQPKITAENIKYSNKTYNQNAKDALKEQWPDYSFYPYTTRTEAQANGKDYIFMTGKAGADGGNVQNGTMTLSAKAGDVTLTGEYAVSPFFANALQITKIDDGQTRTEAEIQAQIYGNAKDYSTVAGILTTRTIDGVEEYVSGSRTKNFHADLGGADNRYEIRSLKQLQYISWNYEEQTATRLVTDDNKRQFNYLTYWKGSNTSSEKIDVNHTKNVNNYKASECYWWQTHDAVAPSSSDLDEQAALNQTLVENGGGLFTPIAGSTVSSEPENYNSRILAWFGGHYDGQSYVLKNFEIHSDSFTVGAFGATVSAEIQNVILYSDRYNMIERVTKPSGGQVNEKRGAYVLGGMVGLAYSYNAESNTEKLVISNCAISGYQIVDSSTNQGGLGDANIGGLLGAAYATIQNCSSVVDIRLNCAYQKHAKYGSYMRAGGLVGAIQYEAINCYSGGNVYIGEYADKTSVEDRPNTVDGQHTNTLYEMDMESLDGVKRNFETALLDPDGDGIYDYYWVYDKTQSKTGENIKLLTSTDRNADTYLKERRDQEDPKTRLLIYRKTSTNIYVGGISGSTFSADYLNFESGGKGSGNDRQATFRNCYTYMNLPKMEGNIRAVSYMGNVADRFGTKNSKVTQINCYYLNGISPDAVAREGDSTYTPDVPFNLHWYSSLDKGGGSGGVNWGTERRDEELTAISGETVNANGLTGIDEAGNWTVPGEPNNPRNWGDLGDILLGNISSLKKIQYNDEGRYTPGEANRCDMTNLPASQDYETMEKTEDNATDGMRYHLNDGANSNSQWEAVTNSTGTANLEGRYSFPGRDEKLLGADYPFPTIIKQYDPVSKDVVKVHYGAWPTHGAYWQAYLATMDIFGDMEEVSDGWNLDSTADDGWWAEKTFTLCDVAGTPDTRNFRCTTGDTVDPSDVAKVVAVSDPEPDPDNPGTWKCNVKILAKKRGNVTVIYANDPADFTPGEKDADDYQDNRDDGKNPEQRCYERLKSRLRWFKLTVSAGEIETGGVLDTGDAWETGDLSMFASDKDSTTAGSVSFKLYAKQKNGTMYFTDNGNGDWSTPQTAVEHDKALPIQNGGTQFLKEDIVVGEVTDGGKYIPYTVRTNGVPGEFFIASTFRYDYHSNEGGEKFPIQVTTPSLYAFGALGLANDPAGHRAATYSHVERVSGEEKVVVETSSRPPEHLNPTGELLFLYETATDAVQVEEVTPDGETETKMVPALQTLKLDIKDGKTKLRLTDAHAIHTTDGNYYYPYSLIVTLDNSAVPGYDKQVWYIKPSDNPDEDSTALTEEEWEEAYAANPNFWKPKIRLTFDAAENVKPKEGENYQYRNIFANRIYDLKDVPLPATFDLTIPVIDPNNSEAVYYLSTQITGLGEGVDYQLMNPNPDDPGGEYDPNDPGAGEIGSYPVSGDGSIYRPVPIGGGGNTSSSGGGAIDQRSNYCLKLDPNGGTVTVNDTAWDNGNGAGQENGKAVEELVIYSTYRDGQYYVTLPKVTGEMDGGSFGGWSVSNGEDAELDYPVDENGQYAGEILVDKPTTTLYAYWAKSFVTVNFYLDENTLLGSQMIPLGREKTLKPFSEMLTETNGKLPESDRIPLNFFFTGWEDQNGNAAYEDKASVLFNEGDETQLETLDLYAVRLGSIPVNMMVNGNPESHSFSRDADGDLLLDRYQNPAFPKNVTLLGWYAGTDETAPEVLRVTSDSDTPTQSDSDTPTQSDSDTPTEPDETPTQTVTGAPLKSADGTPLDMEIMMDSDELYALYQQSQSGAITLYNKCLVKLLGTERKEPVLGPNMGVGNDRKDQLKNPSFIDAFENVSFPDGDKLEIRMTLHGYNAKEKDGVKQNILSVGTEAGVKDWDEREQAIHFTYPRNANNRYIRISNSAHTWWDTSAPLKNFADNGSILTVVIDKSGIEIQVNEGADDEGADIIKSAKKNADTSASMNSLLKKWEGDNKLYVASIDGDNRTCATDYVITLTRNLDAEGRQTEFVEFNQPVNPDATTIPPAETPEPEPTTDNGDTNAPDAGSTDNGDTSALNSGSTDNGDTSAPDSGTPGEGDTNASDSGTSGEGGTNASDSGTSGESETGALSGETPDEQTQTQDEQTDNSAALMGNVSGAPDDDATLYGAKPESAPSVPDADSDAALYGWRPKENPGAEENSGAVENPENELPAGWDG